MHFFTIMVLPEEIQPGCSEKEVEQAIKELVWIYNYKSSNDQQRWMDYFRIGGEFDGYIEPAQPLKEPQPKGMIARFFPPKKPTNVAPIEDVLQMWRAECTPDVVITPEGKDYAVDDREVDSEGYWSDYFKALLAKYEGHLVVGLDCHV